MFSFLLLSCLIVMLSLLFLSFCYIMFCLILSFPSILFCLVLPTSFVLLPLLPLSYCLPTYHLLLSANIIYHQSAMPSPIGHHHPDQPITNPSLLSPAEDIYQHTDADAIHPKHLPSKKKDHQAGARWPYSYCYQPITFV